MQQGGNPSPKDFAKDSHAVPHYKTLPQLAPPSQGRSRSPVYSDQLWVGGPGNSYYETTILKCPQKEALLVLFICIQPGEQSHLSGTELAILSREPCDSKVAISIDKMRFGWQFWIDFLRFYFIAIQLIFCFSLRNFWRFLARDSGIRAIRDSVPLRISHIKPTGVMKLWIKISAINSWAGQEPPLDAHHPWMRRDEHSRLALGWPEKQGMEDRVQQNAAKHGISAHGPLDNSAKLGVFRMNALKPLQSLGLLRMSALKNKEYSVEF